MSDMDNEELEATRNKTVRQAYDTVYTEMCRYMELYNQAEERIKELEEELENKTYNITIPLENTGLEDIEYYYKKGDKWYAHYKETQVDKTKTKELEEQAKSKVTEQELKDMIIGMLE